MKTSTIFLTFLFAFIFMMSCDTGEYYDFDENDTIESIQKDSIPMSSEEFSDTSF